MAFSLSRVRLKRSKSKADGIFRKNPSGKAERGSTLYGWHHNTPWSKYNAMAWWQDERRDERRTIVGFLRLL